MVLTIMKNILLTSLGYTKDLMDMKFFHHINSNGEKKYCSGISTAEAGTKYILSNYKIDEIIVIGTSSAINEFDTKEKNQIRDLSFFGLNDFNDFSEYKFYCYRIQQFIDDLDIEANDIYMSITQEEKDNTLAYFDTFCNKYYKHIKQKDLFVSIDNEEVLQEAINSLYKDLPYKQLVWLIYNTYAKADSYYKMHSLNANKDLSIRFIEVQDSNANAFDYQRFNEIINNLLLDSKESISLYLDLQGLDFFGGISLFNLLSLYNNTNKVTIKEIIESTALTNSISSPIIDEKKRLEIQDLRTGINVFTKYGKIDYLKNCINKNEINNSKINRLILGMEYVEEGISLCNIPVLKYGMDVIRKTISSTTTNDLNDVIYKVLLDTLKEEYGKLLEGEEINIIELLKWSLDNQMYQQALTILESQIPNDMVKRGIFYYAKDKKDIDNLLSELNVLYWNENKKTRYFFEDISHYFIKSYGRFKINHSQNKDQVVKDYTQLRIDQIKGVEGLLPAYCNLHNDKLLYEILFSYYKIGNLRNSICHANPPNSALNGGEELEATSNLDIIKSKLLRFINLYESALNDINSNGCKPLLVDSESFKLYRNSHRLRPFEQADENVLENSCLVDYNGKDISIVVKMLVPEKD